MIKTQIREIVLDHKNFARKPLEEIARLPQWSTRQVVFSQLVIAAISGVLAGILNFGVWKILQGFLIFPVFALIMNLLLTSFFYYYFQIFERRTVSFLRLQTLVYFASLPFFLFHIGAFVFMLCDLFGLAMTSILLVIGLTENFQLPKQRSIRLIGAIFGLLFLLWVADRLTSSGRMGDFGQNLAPRGQEAVTYVVSK